MRFYYFLIVAPLLVALAVLGGCGGGSVTKNPKQRRSASGDEAEVARTPVGATKFGTITGKVIYDGTAPTPQPLKRGANEAQCHAPAAYDKENFEEQWLVDGKGGVKNVVVFLQPPEGKFFDLPEDQQKPKANVVEIDQPLCAFRPRVWVLFPSFYDKASRSEKPTGQKLEILNNAPFEHNYKLIPAGEENQKYAKSTILKSRQSATFDGFQPAAKEFTIMCDIHNWMRSYGFVLEHPYAAVTKDDGTFVIQNAPLGVPLQVVGWHEGAGFFNGGQDGKTMTLQDNQVLELPKIKSR
jgi:hypothetical protein